MIKSKSLFKISATAIAVLHGINKLIESTTVSYSKKTAGKFYHWKHGDIYYKKVGKGQPILLIHDLTVFSSNYEWSKVINNLSLYHTVYTLDLIGCGKSDKPEITYTNYFYVQMIQDFAKDIIGEPVKVVASGLSSSIILTLNQINKELFTDIMLINPQTVSASKKTPDDRSKILINLFSLPIIGKTAYYLATSKQNTEYYLTEKCVFNPFLLKSSTVKAYYDAAHTAKGSGKMLLASLEGYYLNMDLEKSLYQTENNIYLVVGNNTEKKDEIIQSYEKRLSNVKTFIIPNSKLLPQLENAEKICELIYSM